MLEKNKQTNNNKQTNRHTGEGLSANAFMPADRRLCNGDHGLMERGEERRRREEKRREEK